jgi:Ala-tRNA(Pro) deacylase
MSMSPPFAAAALPRGPGGGNRVDRPRQIRNTARVTDAAPPALTPPALTGRARLDALLAELGIDMPEVSHPPVFTVEEAAAHPHNLPGLDTKNLFLKDNKGALFLVTLRADRRADLKALPASIGSKRLSFGSAETLFAALGVTPGSVTPLAMLNDVAHVVQFSLDRALAEGSHIVCHPLVNTASVSLATPDLLRLLAAAGVTPRVIDLDAGAD